MGRVILIMVYGGLTLKLNMYQMKATLTSFPTSKKWGERGALLKI